MFGAVGEAYGYTYLETLKRNLKPGGRAVLQVIMIQEQAFEDYRRNPDFIQRYISAGMVIDSVYQMDPVGHAVHGLGGGNPQGLSARSSGRSVSMTDVPAGRQSIDESRQG